MEIYHAIIGGFFFGELFGEFFHCMWFWCNDDNQFERRW